MSPKLAQLLEEMTPQERAEVEDDLLPRLEDVVCLLISSAMPEELLRTDFILEPGHASFLKTGLEASLRAQNAQISLTSQRPRAAGIR